MKREVLRTYLEMTDAAESRPVPSPDPTARVERVENCPASFFRYLYVEVGRNYHWRDRLALDGRGDPRAAGGPVGLAAPAERRRRARRVLRAAAARRRLGRDRLLRLAARVPGPRPRQVPAGRGRCRRVATGRVAGLAAHLLARRPGRTAELPSPAVSVPSATETYEAELSDTPRRRSSLAIVVTLVARSKRPASRPSTRPSASVIISTGSSSSSGRAISATAVSRKPGRPRPRRRARPGLPPPGRRRRAPR